MALNSKMTVMGVPCEAAYVRINKVDSGPARLSGHDGNAIAMGRTSASAVFQVIFSEGVAKPAPKFITEDIPENMRVEGGPTTKQVQLVPDPAPVLMSFHVSIDAEDNYNPKGDIWAQLFAKAKKVLIEQYGATAVSDV
jgi:hypothetical protein